MNKNFLLALVSLAILAAGCGTTGGSQLETTVYDTHRRVVKLDKSLEASVDKLNQTAAELSAQVAQSDEATGAIRSIVEENQVKIANLDRDLRGFKEVAYRQWGVTTGSSFSSTPLGGATSPGVIVERPDAVAAVPSTTTSPDAERQYQQAQRSYTSDDYNTALRQFDEHLQRYPGSSLADNAQFWKAKCHLQLDQYREAIQNFEALWTNHRSSTKVPYALHNAAVAYSRLGQNDKAVELLKRVIDQYPVSPAAEAAKNDLQKLES